MVAGSGAGRETPVMVEAVLLVLSFSQMRWSGSTTLDSQ
jgi:hypothetical protein